MKNPSIVLLVLWLAAITQSYAQSGSKDNPEKRHFVGSTLFVLATPLVSPSPEYYQLNYGYRLTPKDVISVEAITWAYRGPLGRPHGPDFDNPASDFPGKVKAYGAGLAYKRFIWKGAYGQIHSTAFRQNYLNEDNAKIQGGFQLFNTLRLGYHIRLFKNRWFVEPSIATTSWPVNTNLPASFQVKEDAWPSYFLFEPGLHFGVNF